ncbi:MAG: ATP-dependent endonuclease, partial [Candidatus Thorarchaeota archaeon]
THLQKLIVNYTLPSYTHGKRGEPTVSLVQEKWEDLVLDLATITGWSSEFREATIIGYTAVAQGNLPRYEWLPAVRDATDETRTTQKSRFGEIFGEVLDESTSSDFAQSITELLNQIRDALNITTREDVKDQTNPLVELERELNELFNEHMSGTSIHLSFDVPDLKTLMKQGSYVEIDDGVRSGLEHKGHGMQRLFLFMLLRVYAKRKSLMQARRNRKFILAIEEPELYLHPPAQRQLLQVLKLIAPEQQILLCTHSPYFIDLSDYHEICVVSRDSKISPTKVLQSRGDIFLDNERNEFKLLSRVDPTRSELFFSKKVILVEGDTERMTVPIIGEKLGYNFPLEGITVIEAGGKMGLPFFMKIMNSFGIKYLTIHDEDPFDPDEEDTEKLKEAKRIYNYNTTIEEALGASGNLLTVEGDFEKLPKFLQAL